MPRGKDGENNAASSNIFILQGKRLALKLAGRYSVSMPLQGKYMIKAFRRNLREFKTQDQSHARKAEQRRRANLYGVRAWWPDPTIQTVSVCLPVETSVSYMKKIMSL